jgi:hypothetical protein
LRIGCGGIAAGRPYTARNNARKGGDPIIATGHPGLAATPKNPPAAGKLQRFCKKQWDMLDLSHRFDGGKKGKAG